MYYKSRYHLTNGLLSLAIDSLTGELLELVCEKTGENLIKNHSYALPQPFAILTAGEKACLHPGDAEAISRHPELKPVFHIAERSATVAYEALWDGTRMYGVAAEYTVELPAGKAESLWKLSLNNGSQEALQDVRFPCLNGIYLGESWTENTLVYPYVAGIKVRDPVTAFARESHRICWKWQDYKYVYTIGTTAQKYPDGLYGIEEKYAGNLSMKWLDYYGTDFGLYFACHDPVPRICSLRADTLGPASPGMNFSIRHPLGLCPGESWSSPEAAAALHGGDWHEGAKRYRAFHRGVAAPGGKYPEWFAKSAGLVAHYDFKYQNGGVVHRFREIGQLLEEAKVLGLNHLLLAGWHKDGFDNGFPEYVPDSELGTEAELKEQIGALVEQGGHVCFYVNSRLVNTKYEHLKDFIAENSVRLEDGSLMTEQYGAGGMRFAVQCIGSSGWRKKLEDTVNYVTGEIGTDGMYLDQLVMGSPCLCRNPNHDHGFGEWVCWYQKMLEHIHEARENSGKDVLSILHEGVADAYGPLVSGQLVSTFSYHHCGAFPELYRYTFPEHFLVDMLYPQRNLAMRPVHVAQASREILDRAFRTGMYYWIYDLADDNTFTRDPGQYQYLKDMIRLRKFWLEQLGQGVFRDEDDLLSGAPGVKAACYRLDGSLLLACSNTTGKASGLSVSHTAPRAATAYTPDDLPAGTPASWKPAAGGISVEVPPAPLSLLLLEE